MKINQRIISGEAKTAWNIKKGRRVPKKRP